MKNYIDKKGDSVIYQGARNGYLVGYLSGYRLWQMTRGKL